MDYSAIIIFIAGGIIGFFIAKLLFKKAVSANDTDQEVVEVLKNENLSLKKDVEHLELRIEKSIEEFNKQKERERELQQDKIDLSSQLSESKTKYLNIEERLREQKAELEQLQEKFTKEFKLAANAILKQNSVDFSKVHQKELEEILNPLKEKIKSFETSVEKKYVDETKERAYLKQEIKQLMELNQTLNLQAENLTNALKGENKTQGNWGEMVLERILESSGLIKGQEYETQYSDTNAENTLIRPDVIIKLPDNKHIIIDAKVSLTAYEKMVSSKNEDDKLKQLKLHIQSVKNHVKQLSEKSYFSGKNLNSPDFVLLFMPIEPSFSLAAQHDEGLFSYAWDKKVVIVSPSTLLASLRTISSVWKQERQTKNAYEIADRAGRLYDKFKAFIDDMQKIERGLNSAQSAYSDAFNKLSSGKGNIISRAEKIKEMGAKTNKNLSEGLLIETDDE